MATLAIVFASLALVGIILVGIGVLIFNRNENSSIAAWFCGVGAAFFVGFSLSAVTAADARDSQRDTSFSTHCLQSGGTPYRTFHEESPVCLKGVK